MNADTKKDLEQTQTDADQDPQGPDAQTQPLEDQEQVTDIDVDLVVPDLAAQLAEKEAQVAEYADRLKRVQADFQNYKKRKEKEQAQVYTMTEDRLIAEFLPLYDDLRRAFEVFQEDENKDVLIDGVERIFAKFKDFLDSKMVQPVEAVGQKFDPAFHEVLLTVEAEGDPHRVIEEYECGYTRQGRLLRPSRVTVSKPVTQPDADEPQSPAGSASDPGEREKE